MANPNSFHSSWTRRDFNLTLFPGILSLQLASRMGNAPIGSFGLTFSSFQQRFKQYSQQREKSAGAQLPAEIFLDLVKSFGADGCQIELSQLSSRDPDYLQRIKKICEGKSLFVEVSIDPGILEQPDNFSLVAGICQGIGSTRLRTALSGIRSENFVSRGEWQEFTQRWQKILSGVEPLLKQGQLTLGIENNQDWRAEELAAFLKSLSSPWIGACVDMGNNLCLLEDPVESMQVLGPYVISSHLKDVALARDEEGFWWSEVPLGQGILPLSKLIETLRRHRRDIRFCLDMQTRDAVKVNYLADSFWNSLGGKDPAVIAKFEATWLARSAPQPPPRISSMSSARALALEDENIRRSVAYAKRTLGF